MPTSPLQWVYLGSSLLGLYLLFRDQYSVGNLPMRKFIHSTGTRTPTGPEFDPLHLPSEWGYSRKCEFVAYMRSLLRGSGISGRPATLLIAHIARETAYGGRVFDNNFGNIKEYGSGLWYRHPTNGLTYRAFESPRAGLEGNLRLLHASRYARPWAALLAGDKNWYQMLGEAGYYELTQNEPTFADHQRDYERFLTIVESCG